MTGRVTPAEAAARYGTPLYLYDLDEVAAAHAALTKALSAGAVLHYSVKANPHPAVVGALARLGCRVEVSSPGELSTALAVGFLPRDITYTGPAKTSEEVRAALAGGVIRFSVESARDLATVADAARGGAVGDVECLLRVNADDPVPGMGLAMGGVSSKFGVDCAQVLADPEAYRGQGAVRITGLHLYMGTNLQTVDVLLRQFETALRTAVRLSGFLGSRVRELNLGGGFGAPYACPDERADWSGLETGLTEMINRYLPRMGAAPKVSFESGRYLVGSCGTLVTSVVDLKESKGELYALLDSGVHHLGGMSGLRRLPPVSPAPVRLRPGHEPGGGRPTHLVGPLCTPADRWGSSTDLTGIQCGDLLAVPNTGAYGLTASLVGFLSYPAPVEVVTGGGQPTTASRLALVRTPVERL